MKKSKFKISIIITSYNRPLVLEKNLKNLITVSNVKNCNIVIVQQDINKKFINLFKKINHKNFYILKTKYPKIFNPHKKMILNGFKGMKFAFENLKSDICFYVEDDIILAKDAIQFGTFIINRYKRDKNFFAVNFFSKMKYSASTQNLYSKFIYGIGKGWGISKNKWKLIKKFWDSKFINSQEAPLYDSPIEEYIKSQLNYVVMPINSRSYEIPSNGVNINLKNDKKYFKEFKSSFVGSNYSGKNYKYSFFQKYYWRSDCIKYKGRQTHKVTNYLKKIIKKLLIKQ
tara:strand:- start:432 stop:1289 length:858 start_codon:yes stop_codon:yes gene_type:complete